jgi:hypothetical protein
VSDPSDPDARAPDRAFKRWNAFVLVALWALVAGAGMVVLVRYSLGPGRQAHAPVSWPAGSRVPHRPGRPTLVMIAHPKCACTRASISELAVLITHCRDRASVSVLFVRPSGTSRDWDETDLRRSAEGIPGVTVLTDADGHEAALFGASTSGQVLLYDGRGWLQFSGGITDGRGHAGDNPGRAAVEHLLHGQAAPSTSPVFGCSLFASNEAGNEP